MFLYKKLFFMFETIFDRKKNT